MTPAPRPNSPSRSPRHRGAAEALRVITSGRNPWVRQARALQHKRTRREERLMVAEGEDLLQAALDHGVRPAAVLVDQDRQHEVGALLDRVADLPERYAVPSEILATAVTLAAVPRVVAILPQPDPPAFRDLVWPPRAGVWLAGIADPGNVGTLVRSAAALGADWLALGPGSADAFHPRALRAAMGATFTLPILEGVRATDLASRTGFTVVAATPRGGVPPWEAPLGRPMVLALGGERDGVDPAVDELEAAGVPVARVTIPQTARAESLNVAAAGAALLAEALRQRSVL